MVMVYESVCCLCRIFECIPKWSVINQFTMPPSLILLFMLRCGLILDYGQKDDYNKQEEVVNHEKSI